MLARQLHLFHRSCVLRLLFISAGFHIFTIDVFPQTDSFVLLLRDFENAMNHGAKSYMKENYTRALDYFHLARGNISKNMPSPSEKFQWYCCVALKSYAMLLARMAEIDLYKQRNDSVMIYRVKEQAIEWGKTLEVQYKQWNDLETNRLEEIALRKRWIRLFRGAISESRKITF